jgi:hypothetical protein
VRGVDETLEHVAAGRGISFLARSATVFYTHPDVSFVPVPELAPDQVCIAVATSHTSPIVDDFFAAAQAAAGITAECGNYKMWQLGGPTGSASEFVDAEGEVPVADPVAGEAHRDQPRAF